VEFIPMWYIILKLAYMLPLTTVVHSSTYVNLDMKYLKFSFPFVGLKASYPPTSTLTSPGGILCDI